MNLTKRDPKPMTLLAYKFTKLYNGLIFFNYYEHIWSCLCLFVSVIAAVLFKNVVQLLTNPEYNAIFIAKWGDLLIVIPVIAISWVLRDSFTYYMKSRFVHYVDPKTYQTDEDRNDRSEVLCKFTMDFTVYTLTTIFMYLIVKDTKFLPPYLLGSGDVYLAHGPNFPEYEEVPYLREMYLFQMGYHSYACLFQIARKRNDRKFFEFLLHHTMALFLIVFSYCINLLNSGILVLLTHDISDALLVFARGYGDYVYKSKKVVNLVYVVAFASWVYTRLFAFPKAFIIPTIVGLGEYQEKYRHLVTPIMVFLLTMTCVLLIMHVYWSIFMVKALFYSTVKNKVKVEYDLKHLKGNKKEKS